MVGLAASEPFRRGRRVQAASLCSVSQAAQQAVQGSVVPAGCAEGQCFALRRDNGGMVSTVSRITYL